MKGRISLNDFIHRVKAELVAAQQTRQGDPFYELKEVSLEVSFAVDASAKAGFDLYVVDLSGETKAQQTHKVTLKLTPLPIETAEAVIAQAIQSPKTELATVEAADIPKALEHAKKRGSGGGGGGGGGGGRFGFGGHGPVYDKIRDRG